MYFTRHWQGIPGIISDRKGLSGLGDPRVGEGLRQRVQCSAGLLAASSTHVMQTGEGRKESTASKRVRETKGTSEKS